MVGTVASHFKTHDVEMDSFCVGESPTSGLKYVARLDFGAHGKHGDG